MKIDYGNVRFKGRKLEAILINFQIKMKNRQLGAFETYCKKIHITYDLDFDMWRKEFFGECDQIEETNQWKERNDFESGWIITVD